MQIDLENLPVYTGTLFALARDAWHQNRQEAYAFVRSYLVGLVPSSALDAFETDLGVPSLKLDASRPVPKPNGNGGTLVTNPKPPPPLPPAPSRLRESETIKW